MPEASGKYYQIHVSDGRNEWIEGDGIIDDNGNEDIYTVEAAKWMRKAVASRLKKSPGGKKYCIRVVIWSDGIM